MSYSRQYKKKIDIPVRIDVDHPLVSKDEIKKGKIRVTVGDTTRSYNIDLSGGENTDHFEDTEDIHIDINVDTEEYDCQSDKCSHSVNLLTGSVVATEAAQVANIDDNSKKIASSIVTGFFKNVKSSLSTIAVEQKQKLESSLAHLRMQAEELLKKQKQMDNDYQRTSARYIKIFQDLNHELEVRVKSLDIPVYKAVNNMSKETNRLLDGDDVYVSSVINTENATLTTQISAAIIKTVALEMTEQAIKFLSIYEEAKRTVSDSVIPVEINGEEIFLPVVYMQSKNEDSSHTDHVYYNQEIMPDTRLKDIISGNFNQSKDTRKRVDYKSETVKTFFTKEIESNFNGKADEHSQRVREMIVKLFND